LDQLLESLRSDEEPAPKRDRKTNGSGNGVAPETTFQIGQKLTLSQLESFL
jgi:hypothetical protein